MGSGYMRFGAFIAPYHRPTENPTRSLKRDIELIRALDDFGYDEVWIGEHHSGGGEMITSPEIMIATAAAQTRRIRIGTGVSSLPYHHPLILADRMVLLDHLTEGRAMFGAGPGALPADAYMMGCEPTEQRRMMLESLTAIMDLFAARAPVTMETDWFTLREARLQLRPYTRPHMDVVVASTVSPAGARAAGTLGVGMLSLSATSEANIKVLSNQWSIAEDLAADNGHTMNRDQWRLVGPMHIAETKEQAIKDVEFGLAHWVSYFQKVASVSLAGDASGTAEEMVDMLNASGLAVIGTVEDAATQIARLEEHTGGFGAFLFMAHDWANREATLRSYDLCSRELFPIFQGSADGLMASQAWVVENRPTFSAQVHASRDRATREHAEAVQARA